LRSCSRKVCLDKQTASLTASFNTLRSCSRKVFLPCEDDSFPPKGEITHSPNLFLVTPSRYSFPGTLYSPEQPEVYIRLGRYTFALGANMAYQSSSSRIWRIWPAVSAFLCLHPIWAWLDAGRAFYAACGDAGNAAKPTDAAWLHGLRRMGCD
jgi:hypothetical protein